MYAQSAAMAAPGPQKPETFMMTTEAQQALPHATQVALQQVDNCKLDVYLLMMDVVKSLLML
jgi:transcription factor STE12